MTQAARLGADAVLVVTPAYVKPSQKGLIEFYRLIADKGALPIVLYNVSALVANFTGLNRALIMGCGKMSYFRNCTCIVRT